MIVVKPLALMSERSEVPDVYACCAGIAGSYTRSHKSGLPIMPELADHSEELSVSNCML